MALKPKRTWSPPPVWPLFAGLAALLALLSYGPFPLWTKVALFALGIAAALLWGLSSGFSSGPADFQSLYQRELFPRLPAAALALLAAGAVFIRFYDLTSLSPWPGLDESLLGMFAIRQSEAWSWKFFYTFGQVPPLPIWSTALLLKAGCGFLFSLWFPPALVSTLTVLLGYAAARRFFSKSFALLLGGLLGFSYWPFLIGRISHQGGWVPLWAFLCLYLLGRFLQAAPGFSQRKEAALLGLATGLGSMTFTPWPVFALAVMAAAGARLFFRKPKDPGCFFFCFLPVMAVSLAPFGWAAWHEGYGQHLRAMSALSGWFTLKHQVLTVLSYVTCLFWGTLEGDSAYTASRGGLLNPLWGAAFLAGLLSLLRNRSHAWVRWAALAFFLGLLPGWLSMNVESFRITPAFPFLFFTAATGLAELLWQAPPARRWRLFALLLACGAALDAGRILKDRPFRPAPNSPEASTLVDYRAHEILEQTARDYGPGLVFTEFTEAPSDESLFDNTYGFNAAENPRLREPARWAGLVANPHYYPFLARWFPRAVWYILDGAPGEEPRMVGTIPLNPKTAAALGRWTEAHHYFRDLSLAVNSISEDRTYQEAEREFTAKPPVVAEDPFLEACYWERRAEYFYNYDYKDHYDDQVRALQKALQSGCPAAHLYYKLGSLWARRGQFDRARKAFQAALREEPRYQDALDGLEIVKGMETKAGGKSIK